MYLLFKQTFITSFPVLNPIALTQWMDKTGRAVSDVRMGIHASL
jgi:hypothetical protein